MSDRVTWAWSAAGAAVVPALMWVVGDVTPLSSEALLVLLSWLVWTAGIGYTLAASAALPDGALQHDDAQPWTTLGVMLLVACGSVLQVALQGVAGDWLSYAVAWTTAGFVLAAGATGANLVLDVVEPPAAAAEDATVTGADPSPDAD
jgi:hypothetical protein